MTDIAVCSHRDAGAKFLEALRGKRFSLALILSHTDTASIPGITAAGATPDLTRFTPAADAEFLYYGRCLCINGIPVDSRGLPTPAIMTKAALESASIPHMVIDAGCAVKPALPFISTGLKPGRNIAERPAMDHDCVVRAVEYGRIVGRALAAMTDCLVIGESVPAGTTTALAVLSAMKVPARVSSSMAKNPIALKRSVLKRAASRPFTDTLSIISNMGDPMIPFAAGMTSSASSVSKVILAGGTQMAAVLAVAKTLGYRSGNTIIGTTRYVLSDGTSDLLDAVSTIDGVPVVSVDPRLDASDIPALQAFAEGHAKEGAGAGGCMLAAHLKANLDSDHLKRSIEREYGRLRSPT